MPTYRVTVEGESFLVEVPDPTERPVRAVIEGEVFQVEVDTEPGPKGPEIPRADVSIPVTPQSMRPAPGTSQPALSATAGQVTAPLPGTIVSIRVSEGDHVAPGDELCVLEAMKMNNPIRATQSGIVEEILVSVGQQVQHGTPLVTLVED